MEGEKEFPRPRKDASPAQESWMVVNGDPEQQAFEQGVAFFRQRKFDEALERFTASIRANRTDPLSHAWRARTYVVLGSIEKAQCDCETALEASPDLEVAHFAQGRIHEHLGDVEAAIRHYKRAASPSFVEATNNLGLALASIGDHDAAIEAFNTVLSQQPADVDALNNRALSRAALGLLDAALEDLVAALGLEPTSGVTLNNLGTLRKLMKSFAPAITDLEAAMEHSPTLSEPYNNRGLIYMEMGRIESAISDFEKATELNPEDYTAFANLAAAFEALKKPERALLNYIKSLELCPDYDVALSNKARILDENTNLQKTAELFQELVAENRRLYLLNERAKNPPLAKDLKELVNSPDFSDIQFLVQGQTFYAHKVILCARSPYFRALFLSGMKESALDKITVDDFAATSYYLLLLFIYTDSLPSGVSPQDSMELLMLANQYSLDGLKAAVATIIEKEEYLDVSNCVWVYEISTLHYCPELLELCTAFIATHWEEVEPALEELEDVQADTKKAVAVHVQQYVEGKRNPPPTSGDSEEADAEE